MIIIAMVIMNSRGIMVMTNPVTDWNDTVGKENIADGTGYMIVTDMAEMIEMTGIMIMMQMTKVELL
jgi:hypothetical protein